MINFTEHYEIAIFIPIIAGMFILLLHKNEQLRELCSILASVLLFLYITQLLQFVDDAETHTLLTISPGLTIALHIERLGLVFALLASCLWIFTTIYSIGYMRGNKEKNQTRYYFFFALSMASTMGIALSANLITLFIFYEALTLCTYPLVAHKQNIDARQGGRRYLGILLSTSILFFLTAIVITWTYTGTLDFRPL